MAEELAVLGELVKPTYRRGIARRIKTCSTKVVQATVLTRCRDNDSNLIPEPKSVVQAIVHVRSGQVPVAVAGAAAGALIGIPCQPRKPWRAYQADHTAIARLFND